MIKKFVSALLVCFVFDASALAGNDIEQLREELESLKAEYQTRIQSLETRLEKMQQSEQAFRQADQRFEGITAQNNPGAFNPAISLVLDGTYAAYDQNPEDWHIEGFPLGGEAGLVEEGFSIGHTELSMSANVDDKFYGKLTLALDEHDGEVETELEEAFFQTLGLGAGWTIRGGRFFSSVGYLNQQHDHAWDFTDVPLVYAAMFGNRHIDDGVRLNWIAPTDLFMEVGVEFLRGTRFPGGGEHDGAGAVVASVMLGGDVGISHSWQTGFSYLDSSVDGRTTEAHAHGSDEEEEIPAFFGDSDIFGFNLVYKWAPNGYGVEQNFKLQFEYFQREESGDIEMLMSEPLETATYTGDQSGYYLQAVYQFNPMWRIGMRYDRLDSDNHGEPVTIMEEAGLTHTGFNPNRSSMMLEWVPSEYSRIRFQYNHDETSRDPDDQLFLQYTFSLGNHRAHAF
jgi:outer membrane receptor protein involved in Fe transport